MARGGVILLWLAVLAVSSWYLATRVTVVSDMTLFLPQERQDEGRLLVETLRRNSAARLMLLALQGDDPARLAQASAVLAQRMTASGLFERVANGSESLDDEERARWFRYRYLLTPVVEQGLLEEEPLRLQLQARLRELASPLGLMDKQTLPADPIAAFRQLLAQWQPAQAPLFRHGVWFSADGHALLLAETRAGGFDLDRQEEAQAAIHAAMHEEPALHGLHLISTGPGVIGVMARDSIRSESRWLSAAATAALLALLWWGYRSFRLLWLSALPLATALVVGVAGTALLFGEVHGIAIAFGITLLGVAIDYPLHLFSHLEMREPPLRTLRRIWPTLRLGLLSSVVGYLAMLGSRFAGLLQLATLAICGLVAAALVVRWVVPALLPAAGMTVAGRIAVPPPPPWRHARGGMTVLLLFSLAYVVLSPRPLWQTELAALSPVPADVLQRDRELRASFASADLGHALVLRGPDAEAVLRGSESLHADLEQMQRDGVLQGYALPSQLLPSQHRQTARRAALPSASLLRERVLQAQQDLPFRRDLFEPFIAAVDATQSLPLLTPETVAGTVPASRLQSMLFPWHGEWIGLVPLHAVMQPQLLQQWAAAQSPPLHLLSVQAATTQMMQAFRSEALQYLLFGALLIALLLRVGLGAWRPLAVVLLPIATALLTTVALLHLGGVLLSLFHLVALLLVLGLGMDYALFFARDEAAAERRRTRHAVTLCAISTITVFGILALSELPVLRAIGLTVALGALLGFVLAWLVCTSCATQQRNPELS